MLSCQTDPVGQPKSRPENCADTCSAPLLVHDYFGPLAKKISVGTSGGQQCGAGGGLGREQVQVDVDVVFIQGPVGSPGTELEFAL